MAEARDIFASQEQLADSEGRHPSGAAIAESALGTGTLAVTSTIEVDPKNDVAPNTPWELRANCAGLAFPTSKRAMAALRRNVCLNCIVADECRGEADASAQQVGIWGGESRGYINDHEVALRATILEAAKRAHPTSFFVAKSLKRAA